MALSFSQKYIGIWEFGLRGIREKCSGGNYSSFRVFVDSEKIVNGKTEIEGRIKDKYGRARFKGVISRLSVRFVKEYEPEHSDNHAYKGEIEYEGILCEDKRHRHYVGRWIAFDNDGREHAFGSFVLEDNVNSKTLELLMRRNNRRETL